MFWCSLPLLCCTVLAQVPTPWTLSVFIPRCLSLPSAFSNFLSPLNSPFTTFVWLWLSQYMGKLALDLLLFRLQHTQAWIPQGQHIFVCWEQQMNRETPPTSAAHQYLLIQKNTPWEWTPGSCSSSGCLLIMNDGHFQFWSEGCFEGYTFFCHSVSHSANFIGSWWWLV